MFLVSLVLAIDYPDGEVMGGFEEAKLQPEGSLELRSLIPGDIHSIQGWEGPSPVSPTGHGRQNRRE